MKFDLLAIGDATIDTFLFIEDAQVTCSLHKELCQLCVNYADKLPVQKIERMVAGNAANNAVGSSRLGLKTSFVTQLGNDGSGEWIYKKLKEEKVNTTHISIDKKLETNASTVLSFQGERTIFVYHAPRKYALPAKMPEAKFVYYTSVGENHAQLNKDIVRYIKKSGARLAFNPGTYQMRAGLEKLKPVFAVTDVLFVNKEESSRILGAKDDIRSYLLKFHELGIKTCVITDGQAGSYAYDGEKFYHMGIPKTKVVERTGAGDSFATGFVAALFYGKSVREAMCWGTMNASSVVMFTGPQKGLLTRPQLEAFHKKNKHACAQEI